MEFSILYVIQSIRTDLLDKFFVYLTSFCGNYGQLWIVIGVFLLIFKKTRKCGLTIIFSYLIVFLIGQYGLKDLIARSRPCHIDQSIELLISRPSSYSCPSTHSAWAFAFSTSVYQYNKVIGIFTYLIAFLVAFSRLYLFVHFPTDVLLGVILGILSSLLVKKMICKIIK